MTVEFEPSRFSLVGIIGGLMLSDHLGDVHDEIIHLHDLIGMPRPEGNYLDGWTDEDFLNVGIEPESGEIDE